MLQCCMCASLQQMWKDREDRTSFTTESLKEVVLLAYTMDTESCKERLGTEGRASHMLTSMVSN